MTALDPGEAAVPKRGTSDALGSAETMRAQFDPGLSDAQLQTIAKAIDANNDAAKALNPKKKPLRNGDAPAVRFAVPDASA